MHCVAIWNWPVPWRPCQKLSSLSFKSRHQIFAIIGSRSVLTRVGVKLNCSRLWTPLEALIPAKKRIVETGSDIKKENTYRSELYANFFGKKHHKMAKLWSFFISSVVKVSSCSYQFFVVNRFKKKMFLSFLIIWVFQSCHKLSFWVL